MYLEDGDILAEKVTKGLEEFLAFSFPPLKAGARDEGQEEARTWNIKWLTLISLVELSTLLLSPFWYYYYPQKLKHGKKSIDTDYFSMKVFFCVTEDKAAWKVSQRMIYFSVTYPEETSSKIQHYIS